MKRITGLFLGLFLGAFMVTSISAFAGPAVEVVSGPDGVYCEINEVKLFAESSEDCEKAGGTVTHTVTTTVKPVDDDNDD